MLRGERANRPRATAAAAATGLVGTPLPAGDRHAVVIGGGLAGTASAAALLRRHWRVTLIERHATPAREASGNPVGIVQPYPSARLSPRGSFFTEAFDFTRQEIAALRQQGHEVQGEACGVLQLAHSASKRKWRDGLVTSGGLPTELGRGVEPDEGSALCGFPVRDAGVFFPSAGWVLPPDLCRARLALGGGRLTSIFRREAIRLDREGDLWSVCGEDGVVMARAPWVIIANANDALRFPACASLPLRPVRGQLTLLPATNASRRLETLVCYDGYACPVVAGRHCIGATFDRDRPEVEIDPADHDRNLERLRLRLPDFLDSLAISSSSSIDGRVAFRSASTDFMPVVGPLDRRAGISAEEVQGLAVNLGHGSRGLISTAPAAELLASMIAGDPLPTSHELVRALLPSRFRAGESSSSWTASTE